jgi:hypothetical protein
VQLLEDLLADAQPNDEALSNLVADIRKTRQDAMKDKGTILQGGLFNLARYGESSPFNDVLGDAELKALTSARSLLDRIKALTAYPHTVYYYGKRAPAQVAAC